MEYVIYFVCLYYRFHLIFFEIGVWRAKFDSSIFFRDLSAFRINKYGLLTKREVKMTGYWPSSFFACLWTETKSRSINTQKKNEANIQSS